MSAAAQGVAGPFGVFERMIAWRYLHARRREGFVSVIAAISFFGIMLGVATLIVVMAVMNGFRQEMLDRLLGIDGHLVVEAADQPLGDWQDLTALFATIPGVRAAVPVIDGQVLASGRIGVGSGAKVRGLSEADLKGLAPVAGNVTQGALDAFDAGGGVVLGQKLAEMIGVGIGDNVTLVSPDGEVTELGVNPQVKAYPVAAVFSVGGGGGGEYDSSMIFLSFAEAQVFFKMPEATGAIELFLDDPYAVETIKPVIAETAGRPLRLTDWREANKTFFDALQIERNLMFMALTLIVLVAALNIVSGLVMLVKDKGQDIGILRTIGASRASVMRVFMMTGSLIGLTGTAAGVALGVAASLNIEALQGIFALFSGGSTGLFGRLPAVMNAGETLAVIVMALVLTFGAVAFPAWRAARLDPVEALKSS